MSTRATQVRRRGVAAALASALVTVALLLVSVLDRLDVRAALVGLGRQRGSADSLGDVVTRVAAGGLAVAVTGLAVSLLLAVADVLELAAPAVCDLVPGVGQTARAVALRSRDGASSQRSLVSNG